MTMSETNKARIIAELLRKRAFMEFLHIPTGTQRAINLTKRKEDRHD